MRTFADKFIVGLSSLPKLKKKTVLLLLLENKREFWQNTFLRNIISNPSFSEEELAPFIPHFDLRVSYYEIVDSILERHTQKPDSNVIGLLETLLFNSFKTNNLKRVKRAIVARAESRLQDNKLKQNILDCIDTFEFD